MSGYIQEDLSPEELAHKSELASSIAESVRELIDATVRTEVDETDIAEARRLIEAATAILRKEQLPGAFGIRFNADGTKRSWGNAVLGRRNPIAPPVVINHEPDLSWTEVELGAAYEGPAGLVHGGVLALILDQLLGSTAEYQQVPGMTGTLTVRYRSATPLGRIRGEARVNRVEGVKTFVTGSISVGDKVTAEAEGIFILPKWARGEKSEVLRRSVGEG
ncbi:thioesterase [Gordonia paraffinivorans]|uniref:PaaI family thioesterase n=1 Tax=Gordonia paraffinivorans TaxID=175628 RepID=UPI000D61EE43|nr:PaaI family thioesterase [Gordonia paraffinivorans]PWD41736.1 thioesterase [Gordonia paraffinivorans]